VTSTHRAVDEEKCFFGQRRPMNSVASGLHQLDEPIAHWSHAWSLVQKGRSLAALSALCRGPGWTTAGLRTRRALPETASARRVRLPPTTASFGTQVYVAATAALSAVLTTMLMVDPSPHGKPESMALAATVMLLLLSQANFLDNVFLAWPIEALRAVGTLALWCSGGWAGHTQVSLAICAATIAAPAVLLLDVVLKERPKRE
jgi:hypothetical protein